MSVSIKFNDYELQTAERIVTNFEDLGSTEVEVTEMSFNRLDGSVAVGSRYRGRRIRVAGHLLAPTISGFLGLINDFKYQLSQSEKKLVVLDGAGRTREYTASVIDIINIPHEYWSTTYSPYELEFLCADPFGYDLAYTTWSGVSISGALFTTPSLTYSGTAEPLPIISTYITTSGALTRLGFTAGENELTVSRPAGMYGYRNGDILSIDCGNRSVTINDSPVSFSGLFPSFTPQTSQSLATVASSPAGGILTDITQAVYDTTTQMSGSWKWIGQSFKPTATRPCYAVKVQLYFSDAYRYNPENQLQCRIHSDSSGTPGTIIATSSTVTYPTTQGLYSHEWVEFVFPTMVNLTSGTTYWFTLNQVDAEFNYIQLDWDYHVGDVTYTDGVLVSSADEITWTNNNSGDLAFQILTYAAPPAFQYNQEIKYKGRWL